MLKARILTALVLIPLLLAAVIWLSTGYLAVLLGGVILIGGWEWSRLSGFASVTSRLAYVGLIGVSMWYGYDWIGWSHAMQYMLYFVFVCWLLMFVWLTLAPAEKMLSNAVNVYFRGFIGLVLLIPPWLSLLWLHSLAGYGLYLLLSFFILIWAVDSGAYFSGKLAGVTRLAPTISPGKSLEGVYGGLVATIIAAFLLSYALEFEDIHLLQFISLALLSSIFSTIGDLFESVAKRSSGLKDSSNIFPGHGGVMDRIDGLTAAAPVYVLALGWFPALMPGI